MVSLFESSTSACLRALQKREFDQPPDQHRRHRRDIVTCLTRQILGCLMRLKVAPALVRAAGTGVDEVEIGREMDRDAATLRLTEAHDR